MDRDALADAYRLVAELLLHPADRDTRRVEAGLAGVDRAGEPVASAVREFRDDPRCTAPELYVEQLELAPASPLYLGHYLYKEPTSCRGIGTGDRNHYMIEMRNVFRHFGVELSASELPDYVLVACEFLALSLRLRDRDRIGLRRYFLEHHVAPALKPLRDSLVEHSSPYSRLADALLALVDADRAACANEPIWRPPPSAARSTEQSRRLPVLGPTDSAFAAGKEMV